MKQAGKCQQGIVLILSLVLLLILALLGISAANLILLQERMTANAQNTDQAFQAAEAALSDAERDLVENIRPDTQFYADCSQGLCQPATSGTPVWLSNQIDWETGSNIITYGKNTGATAFAGVNHQPGYIIERLQNMTGDSLKRGFVPSRQRHWYRITAVGYSRHGKINVMVQSTYLK